jgi:hypothetical protein
LPRLDTSAAPIRESNRTAPENPGEFDPRWKVAVMKIPERILGRTAGAAVLLAALSLAGASDGASRKKPAGRARPVPFETLERAPFGPWNAAALKLVSRTATWDDWMTDLVQSGAIDQSQVRPCPDVNFSHCSLLVVSLGRQSFSGWQVEVRGLRRSADHAFVDVMIRMPNSDLAIQSFSAPYVIVRIDEPGLRTVEATYETQAATATPAPPSSGTDLPSGTSGNAGENERAVTWGQVKEAYR